MATPAGLSDTELVARFKSGDPAGFEGLLERYKKPLYNLVLRILGDRERAEDVFQDVFLSVLRNIKAFQEGRSFRNWVFSIAVNFCRNELRAAGAQTGLEADGRADEGAGPAELAEKAELAEVLQKGLLELSGDHREVFTLRLYHGMKYAEIGDVLNISGGTAKSRMHYAVVQLRRFMKRHVKD